MMRQTLMPELLEFEEPRARLWSVQWLTSPWYENPDMANRLTGIVGSDATIDSDGVVRIVFAGRDPGAANWLDTTGYRQGVFVTRWIWCDAGPEPQITVLPVSTLRDRLPPDTRILSVEERGAQIARRRSHLARRRR